MRLRIYVDGKPDWSKNVPATPHMSASRGGLPLGQALSHITVAHKGLHNVGTPREPLVKAVPDRWYHALPRCAVPTNGEPCARASGHVGNNHRSRAQMDAENARRLGR